MSSPSPRATEKFGAGTMAALALMAGLMYTTQLALSFIPNVHLTAVLIVLTSIFFGWKAMCAVLIYVVLEGLTYGFGVWWISYLYAWPLLCTAAVLLRKNTSPALWAVTAGAHGLLFGALCALPYIFISGFPAALSYWISGIPFDLIHCASNFALTLVLIKPLSRVMARYFIPPVPIDTKK